MTVQIFDFVWRAGFNDHEIFIKQCVECIWLRLMDYVALEEELRVRPRWYMVVVMVSP